jgi:hypothetical protein
LPWRTNKAGAAPSGLRGARRLTLTVSAHPPSHLPSGHARLTGEFAELWRKSVAVAAELPIIWLIIKLGERGERYEMKKTASIGLVLFLIFFCISLSNAQDIKTVDGVKVVSNGKLPNPPPGQAARIKLTEELSVGQGEDPDQSFAEVSAFVVDDGGDILALDFKDRKVKVYDRTGKFLRLIGKPGQGPGELGLPAGIQLTPDQNLLIEDASNRALSFFKTSGEFVKSISVADKLGLVNVILDPQGGYVAREMGMAGEKVFFEIKKYDQNLKPVFSIDKMDFAVPVPGSGRKLKIMELISVYQVDARGNIFYGRNSEYLIKVLGPDGKHIRSIKKEYDPVKVTQEDIDEMLNRMSGLQTGVNFKEMFEFPSHFPPFQYFMLDEKGRMYVRTWKKGPVKGEFEYDVFDPEGRFISQFITKADLRLWKGDKAYGIEETDDGFRVIKRYAVSWEQ